MLATIALAWSGAVPSPAQHAAPGGEAAAESPSGVATRLRHLGRQSLEREDPVAAWEAFRQCALQGDAAAACLGLGNTHLMLGNGPFAVAYAESALRLEPTGQEAMALCVRALIRSREFEPAYQRALAFVGRTPAPGPELLAARGSAQFRVQRTDEAAITYRRVVDLDPRNAEAHLRLGSGLLAPRELSIPPELQLAAAALAAEQRDDAVELLQRVLRADPEHAIAHRLLGETLFAVRTAASMAMQDEAFAALAAALPRPSVAGLPIGDFVPGYSALVPARRLVVERVAATFRSRLPKLIAIGGRHDLLHELERTTDAPARAALRGRRTFDGRVWDDVRGVGGLRAATGIEALDEAATWGFDTLAHEVAHQVHFHALHPVQQARIRSLYRQAMTEHRCLDFYAASNEAEYFGQGVEAFVSFAKRPGGETTHGHTRFELLRLDPGLHDFIAEIVEFDPLADPAVREPVLVASVAVAMRCGRTADAVVAATLLHDGPERERLLAAALAAHAAARCH